MKVNLSISSILTIFIVFILILQPVKADEYSYSLGQKATHKVGDKVFEWQFSCAGGDCYIGQFIGGDYWIAPKNSRENISINNVNPSGVDNGMMVNPGNISKQGFLSCDQKVSKFYNPSLNLMTKLPILAKPNSSLVKAAIKSNGMSCWGNKSKSSCCVDAYDVLTVLEAPLTDSKKYFRPGFAGNNKKLYKITDLELSKIPTIKAVANFTNRDSFTNVGQRWHSPYVDHYLGIMGDQARAFAPNGLLPNYGAEQNRLYLDDLISVMGPESLDSKLPAITGLFQRGLDLYSSMENGAKWPGGAGQSMGRKPPMVFFGTLLNEEEVKLKIKQMGNSPQKNTQEDIQIRLIPKTLGGGGQPVWGNTDGSCSEDFYWSQLFASQQYAGGSKSPIAEGDSKKTCGDPYGWIDGPAGTPGTAYMACCSTGGFIEYALAQYLMPEMCDVANSENLIVYVNRVLSHGVLTRPDVCAPPDTRESLNCKPHKLNANGCMFYGKTWGPDKNNPGQCIKNLSFQNGRFPEIDGMKIQKIKNEGWISVNLRRQLKLKEINACGALSQSKQ